MSLRCSRILRAAFPLACALAMGACASAGLTGLRMQNLDSAAINAYQAGELSRARDLLKEAAAAGEKAGLTNDSRLARTYVDLGAVYLAMNERDLGLRTLSLALRIDPEIKPSAPLETAPVKKALGRVRAELKRRRGTAIATKEKPAAEGGSAPAKRQTAETAAAKHEAAAPPPAAVAKATPPPPKPHAKEPQQPKAAPAKPAPEPVLAKAPPPPAPKAAVVPEVAKPAAPPEDEEPDLPATVPQPVYCPVPDEAPPETEIALRCVPRAGVALSQMVLFYRSAGKEEFTSVPMVRSRKGWYSAVVPASAVAGKSLQYYVEGRSSGKKPVVTSNGQSDSPNLMSIRAGAAPVGRGTLAAAHFQASTPVSEVKEEDPLAEAERLREQKEMASNDHRRRPRHLFFSAAIGSGWGWHPWRVLEFQSSKAVPAGFNPAILLHVIPEIGYQYDERHAFSLQYRQQFIPESGSGDTAEGHPEHGAWAVLARAYRTYGTANGQFFVSAAIGGGQGFRLVIPPQKEIPRNDTVRGGPIVLGPGAGYVFHASQHFAWVVEGRLLAGLPDFAAMAEFSLGAQVSY